MRKMNELLYKEEMMWLQRARVDWLREGDQNTKFFHQRAAWRARKNRIRKLKRETGEWVQDQAGMKEMVNEYFEDLYSKDNQVNPDEVSDLFECMITDDMNNRLCKPFSEEEISNALFQIGPLKAPGPDGFPARFFQRNWGVVKKDVISAVQQFFKEGRMPEGVNDTAIVLIPKVQHPETLKDYRPISLCNVIYKIVSKCLVNRLRPLLDGIIAENQSAFIPGRLITDNALLAFECIHAIQQDGSDRNNFCAYKLDLAKAYDRVDWSYLEQVLVKLGFHRVWVQWIMSCVTTVRYTVRFNGVLLDTLQPTRGLRQGDPLSPYLFLFVADGLSKVLQEEVMDARIEGVKVCRRAPVISHLLFADDSLLFFRANGQQAERIKIALTRYCRGTGQSINFDKCSILFNAKQEPEVMDEVKNILNIHRATFEAKYLGLPTPEGRMKADRFQAITERLSKRCNAWDERCLSAGGKDILIKSVAQAIPVYVMGVFVLPGPLHEALTRTIRKFWWGETAGKRKTHWIAWDKFTKTKGEGGLGFRDIKLFNQALLARQAWRLIQRPESLSARVLKAKYYPNGNLLDTTFPTNQSPTWKAIVHGLELLKKGVCWRVGSGDSIRIWRDPWIPRGWSRRPVGKRRPCRLKWVSQLIDQSRMEWKEHEVRDFFRPCDVEQILDINLPSKPAEDFIAWHYEKNGIFTVRSAYRLARDLKEEDGGGRQSNSMNQDGSPLWKTFWKIPLPHKVLIFGWRVINNGLASQANKRRRTISLSSTCEICGREEETVLHALFRCNHAATLREAMRQVWELPDEEQLQALSLPGLLHLLTSVGTDMGAKLLLILWRTWQVRNNITHDSEKLTFAGSICFLQKYWTELCTIRQQKGFSDPLGKKPIADSLCAGRPEKQTSRPPAIWEAPQENWLKINVDGAFDVCSGQGGIGVVIRDCKGVVQLTAWRHIRKGGSAEEMEALACKEGLMLAAEWCCQCATLETDCGTIASMLASGSGLRSCLKFIIDEALEAGEKLPQWKVVHKRRECNSVAHELAQLAKRTKHTAVWRFAAPVCVEQIIARECNFVSE